MRSRRIRVALCAALFCFIPSALTASPAAAQRRTRTGGQANDRYFVSAKAGVINLVEGQAELRDGEGWRAAAVKDEMQAGDSARTGAVARLEVLLTPGSFLRAGAGTEFEMSDTSLENLAVNLRRGSLIVEAVGAGDDKPIVTITTPHTQVAVVRGGVYRVEAGADGSEVVVYKGRALVGESLLVKGDRKTIVTPGGAASVPVKFDKKRERDDFDLWSRERAEQLAQDNRRLSRRALMTSLAGYSAFNDPFFGGYGRAGLWVYDPLRGGHTYLPFGWNTRSPYGCNYNTGVTFGNTNTGYYPGNGNNPAPGVTPIVVGGGGNAGGNTGGDGGGNNNGNGATPQPSEPMPHTPQPMPRDSMPSMPDRPMMDRPSPQMPQTDQMSPPA